MIFNCIPVAMVKCGWLLFEQFLHAIGEMEKEWVPDIVFPIFVGRMVHCPSGYMIFDWIDEVVGG